VAVIRIERRTHRPAAEAWRRLTAWERHADVTPLTRVRVRTAPPTRAGTVFTARTGLGRLGFDDPMEVVRWEPPRDDRAGRCRLEKRGRVVLGHAEIEVVPLPDGSSRVRWREEVRVRGVPRPLDPLVALAGRLLFRHVVTALLAG
jgi:hypothetical protein